MQKLPEQTTEERYFVSGQSPDRFVVTGEQRLLINDAISAANPDEDGSLMRELDKRGVGDVVRRIEKSFPKGDFRVRSL